MRAEKIPATPIRYDVDLSDVKRSRIKVAMTVSLAGRDPVDLALPFLSPGAPASDMNHPARLTQLRVTDLEGNEIRHEKLPEGGWRVFRNGEEPFKVSYLLRANEFDFVRNQLNDSHAYMNGSATFMYVKGRERDLPSVIRLRNLPNRSWKSISTLRPVNGVSHAYYSRYFQDLADSNFEVGSFKKVERYVNGTRIEITQHGKSPWTRLAINEVSPEQNLDDFERIYRAFLAEFGQFPSHRYLAGPSVPQEVDPTDRYLINKHYTSGETMATGLEHYHGHELIFQGRQEVAVQRRYEGNARILENLVMAHELGHKLLAKFVQHQGIDVSDFSKDQHTDGLWITEGVTDWIGPVLERRANLITPEQYVKRVEQNINRYSLDYQLNPTNARENSMDAQMGNNEYYNKGGLLGVMLDLEIRHRTHGQKSFRDVILGLKDEFGGTGKYHTLDDIQRITERVGGGSFAEFFDRYLRDRQPIDFNRFLRHAGYALRARQDAWQPESLNLPGVTLSVDEQGKASLAAGEVPLPAQASQPAAQEKPPLPTFIPSLGVYLSAAPDGKVRIYGVQENGPAYEAGLKAFEAGEEKPIFVEGISVKVKSPAARAVCQIDLPVNPKNDTEKMAKANMALGAVYALGGDVELREMIFSFKSKDSFTQEEKMVTIRVPARAATHYVIEELPDLTPGQRRVREGWLKAYPDEVLTGKD